MKHQTNFSIHWKRAVVAILASLPVLWIGLQPGSLFVHENGVFFRKRLALFCLAMVFCATVAAFVPKTFKRWKYGRIGYVVLSIALGGLAFQHITCADGTDILTPKYIPLVLSLCMVLYTAVWLFVWDSRKAALCYYVLMYFCGYAYECIYLFRGVSFKPLDIFSFQTALSVAGSYSYPMYGKHVFWYVAGIFLWAISGWITDQKAVGWLRRSLKMLAVLLSAAWITFLVSTNILTTWHVTTTAFENDTPLLNRTYGTLTTLMKECQQLKHIKPADYDYHTLKTDDRFQQSAHSISNSNTPNVVIVVNESFADLQSLWKIETTCDPMPYLHSLQDSTLYGNLFVSAYGGATCNTEHSFLTATIPTPLLNMPLLATAKADTPALPWVLKSNGYRTIALHPHTSKNYQRDEIYPHLGFDTFYSLPDFSGSEKVRGLTSDLACYQKIMSLFEQKASDERLFVYTLTLQNHSDYTNIDIEKNLDLCSHNSHPELTNYLNLLSISDRSLQQLIEYFEKQSEPVIVLFFGDHQPNMNLSTYDLQENLSDVKIHLKQSITPFFIWANYPIETGYIEAVSVNYLAPLLLQTAGLPLTGYDEWLLDVMRDYPVVVLSGYADSAGTFTEWDAAEWPQELQLMNHLRYNRLYDAEHRLPALGFANE